MKTERILLLFCLLTSILAVNPATLSAQMLNPSIDREDEPFCYYSQPTDVIGVMDGQEGTLVTPEGYLYTGYGEFIFFTGNPPEPVRQRVKTLYKGHLPVIEYEFVRDAVSYHLRMFAATLDGNPESPLMNFVRVSIHNQSKKSRLAFFSIGTRYQNDANTSWGVGDNRFGRPAEAKVLGQFEQAGVQFSKDWRYAFDDGMLLRGEKVMYLYPEKVQHVKMLTLKTGYNEQHPLSLDKLDVLPTTPVGIVMYRLALRSDEAQSLEFRIPYSPLSVDDPDVAKLREASFDDYLGRTVAFWEKIFGTGIEITVPEEKVVNTFKANLVYDLIARNKQEGSYIQKVNEFQYDAFWLRDASFIVRAYDLSGYHDIAKQCLEFFPRWQQDDGNFVSQGGQFDGWGQTLWAFGQHYRITRDKEFAEEVFPHIEKAVEWLRQAREEDPLHILPVTTPGDNEDITGHVTGHNFWALAGLRNAIALAHGIEKNDEAEKFQEEYTGLRDALLARLSEVTAKTGGYIPPGLDSLGGQDWGNMMSVYPEIILDPQDPMVTATLNTTRAKYQEGIMTYGDGRWLHHYLTMKNTETETVRGDQEMAIRELYALLLHTSATHAGFEFAIRPWGDRDFGMNLSPHGWFSAKFRAALRNMLVREQDEDLHLLSCVSPEWIQKDKAVSVRRASTNFGMINFSLTSRGSKASLVIESDFVEKPKSIVLHLPWFMNVRSVKVDGKSGREKAGTVILSPDARRVELDWSRKSGAPDLDYIKAVQEYKKEYRRRYEESLVNGHLPD